jgi:alpha-L-rhamnosidase
MMMTTMSLTLVALLFVTTSGQGATRLRVEYLDAPLSIDEARPRFSFARTHPNRGVSQTAYHVSVTEVKSGMNVWDSGVVPSASSLNIEFGSTGVTAANLTSDTDYRYTVQWYDAAGAPSAPAASTFSTALLEGVGGGWGAQWLAPAAGDKMLRAEFNVAAAPVRARLYISGLGYYRSFINSQVTDAHVMGSFTTFERRVLYDVWDVTALLREGCNSIGVLLGRGWYNQSSIKSGPLSLWALLSVDTSDGARAYFATALGAAAGSATPLAFSSAPGPVVSDEIYLGEEYDARLEQAGWAACGFGNASAWSPARPTRDATANASFSAHHVPVMPDLTLSARGVSEPRDGVFVIDFGRNMAGLTTLRVTCPDGPQTIRVDYAETLKDDGTILQFYAYPYPLIMTSNFTCAGTGEEETYTTLFSQYGFQYAQITNFPGTPTVETLTASTINSAVGQASALTTSNELLNRIQLATRTASISNLMDVPTDCPQRERRGWLGDGQISFETVLHNFDAAAFYMKWIRDIRDTQLTYKTGAVADVAPFYNHGGLPGDPAWAFAYPLIVSWFSDYFADDRIVREHYAGIKALVDFEITQLAPASALLEWGRYGDWCSCSLGANTSCHFNRTGISSFYFIRGVEILADFATRLNMTRDAQRYGALAAATRASYEARLYNAAQEYYEDGFPVSQLVALELGTGSAASQASAFSALVAELESGAKSGFPRAPTGGIIFQKYAYGALSRGGRMDLALDVLLASSGMPSIEFWFNESVQTTPASTLWERWQSTATEPIGSFNHIMFGGFGSWLFSDVGGIRRAVGSASWANLDITPPQIPAARFNLTSASVSVDTAMGFAEVAWSAPDSSQVGCGRVAEDAALPNGTSLTLSCAGGVFERVAFASFGTPTGSMCPFSVNASCHANTSVAIVSQLCLGKEACTIPATDKLFGDPCPETKKFLAVQLLGSCAATTYSLRARVPTGGVATVRVPIGASAPNTVNISESGTAVWLMGIFQPAVGITAATAANGYVAFNVSSGVFAFELTQALN